MEFSSRAKMLVCVRVWGFLEMAQILYFSDVEFSSRAKILVCVRVCEFLFICLIFKYIWGFIPYGSNSGLSAKAERPEYGQHSLQPPPPGGATIFHETFVHATDHPIRWGNVSLTLNTRFKTGITDFRSNFEPPLPFLWGNPYMVFIFPFINFLL